MGRTQINQTRGDVEVAAKYARGIDGFITATFDDGGIFETEIPNTHYRNGKVKAGAPISPDELEVTSCGVPPTPTPQMLASATAQSIVALEKDFTLKKKLAAQAKKAQKAALKAVWGGKAAKPNKPSAKKAKPSAKTAKKQVKVAMKAKTCGKVAMKATSTGGGKKKKKKRKKRIGAIGTDGTGEGGDGVAIASASDVGGGGGNIDSPVAPGGSDEKASWKKSIVDSLPLAARPVAAVPPSAKSYVLDQYPCRIGVWLAKKSFYVYKATCVPGTAPNALNKMGNLQIGWRNNIERAWDIALLAAGHDVGTDI